MARGVSYESEDDEEPDISHLLCDSSESESDAEEQTKEDAPAKAPQEALSSEEVALLRACFKLRRSESHELESRAIHLGEKTHAKTLFLDLDETLIHADKLSENDELPQRKDGSVEGQVMRVGEEAFYIRKRPLLEKFLETASGKFELVVFTAGVKEYAERVVEFIDPDRKYLKKILSREHCIQRDGLCIKDLSIVKDRKLKDMVIVDNSLVSFSFNLANGVPILNFFEDAHDTELCGVLNVLERVVTAEDTREMLNEMFALQSVALGC